MASILETTCDGTLDIQGNPAMRKSSGAFKSATFIIINQGLMCVSLWGFSADLVLYLTDVLHEGDSSAASNTNNWQGALYFFSFIGGFLADAYLGRCTANIVYQLIYLVGLLLAALSTTLPSIRPSSIGATTTQTAIFYTAMYICAVGFGCYQPAIVSFGADQFDEEHPIEKKQKLEFFSWFYVSLTVGTLLSIMGMTYLENDGKWSLAFWVSFGAGIFALLVFLAPTFWYRFLEMGGNPLLRIAQVLVAAIRKRNTKPPSDPDQLYEVRSTKSAIRGSRKISHTKTFRFLDKAATISEKDLDICRRNSEDATDPWRLCTVTQVEEVKWLLRVFPVWASTIFYTVAYTQVNSLFVIQGAAMNTRVGGLNIPAASLYAVDCVSVVLSILAYNYYLLPMMHWWMGREEGLTGLQRMGIGMPIVAFAMLEAGIVERVRRQQQGHGSNLSVLWQLPQYITTGISEVFTYLGQMHFFYDQAPDAVRSMGSALPQLSVAVGNYVSSLLVIIVSRFAGSPGWIADSDSINSSHLDYFFFLLSFLSLLNFGVFLVSACYYKYTVRHELAASTPTLPFLSSPEDMGHTHIYEQH